MGWVTRSIGDEDPIEMMSNLMDRIVIWKNSNAGTSTHQAAKNIFLDTAVDDSNMKISLTRTNMKWSLGADSSDQIYLLRVNECFVLIRIILLANRYASQ